VAQARSGSEGYTARRHNSVDAHGVTIAAIQALYELSLEQSRRIDRLERENGKLRSRVDASKCGRW
jgi:hypothetical protein